MCRCVGVPFLALMATRCCSGSELLHSLLFKCLRAALRTVGVWFPLRMTDQLNTHSAVRIEACCCCWDCPLPLPSPRSSRWIKRGMAVIPTKFGIAFGIRPLNQGGALVHVYSDGSVLVSHGGVEMGQGLHTKMSQVAARGTGCPCGASVHRGNGHHICGQRLTHCRILLS